MKKSYLIIALLTIIFYQTGNTQFKDWNSKFGVRYNQVFPENEFRNIGFGGNDNFSFSSYKFSFLVEGIYAVKLTNLLELEFNLGYGRYDGDAYCDDVDYGEYKTTIIPFNARLKINPWNFESWNPYIYAGAGVMHHQSITKPVGLDIDLENDNGWAGLIPVGIGSEFALSKNLLLELSLGGALSTSYVLDGFESKTEGSWDSYLNTSVGLLYVPDNCKTDNDNDNLTKCDEEAIGTNPENPDTDGDGLNDGEEFNISKTNPLIVDTDADGLNDFEEVKTCKSNPLISDTDNDGLNDFEEVSNYKTDPLNNDTDGDGLTDGTEVNNHKTNPLLADTDIDGLNDSEEISGYKSNPLKKDTDNGSVDDFTEVKRGSNPLNADDDVLKKKIEKIVIEGINFGFDKTNITKESDAILQKALRTLENYLDVQVEMSGHTDNKGTKKYNQLLSEKRAKAVKEWFVKRGINPDKLLPVGYGMENPLVPNNSKENRQKNRRCEIKQIN